MSRASQGGSNMRPGSFSFSSFRSGAAAASRGLKSAYKDVAQSVAVVQQQRATNGPQGSFLNQVRGQISLDRSRKREEEERGTQRLALFPGWAVRRLEPVHEASGDVRPFKIDVFISGYAYSMRPPDRATRSQKAFMRIAKAFASLPRLPAGSGLDRSDSLGLNAALSRSTEDLLKLTKLPPRPSEIAPEQEAEFLRAHDELSTPLEPPRPNFVHSDPPTTSQRQSTGGSLYSQKNSSSTSVSSTSSRGSQTPSLSGTFAGLDPPEIARLHDNFHDRLRPFWARAVTTGTVRISVYTTNANTGAIDRQLGPIAVSEVPIAADTGYFGKIFSIPFESICQHPGGVSIAFGDHLLEHRLTAIAEYLAPPPLPAVLGALSLSGEANPHAPPVQSTLHALPPPTSQIDLDLTDAKVRLISDIDDTIKVSNILHGVRAVFRNVFVRHLDELACPGMPEFYSSLASQGVKFHYVSNSPFELLPVLSEFLKAIGYPSGSLKLKYYGGRSLFKGLWEPAGERKRAGVVEVMDYFPSSKFFLVGDSGEQDMELYTSLVKEFHRAGRKQILGVFIRDVNPEPSRSDSIGLTSSSRSSSPSRRESLFLTPSVPEYTATPQRESFDSGAYFSVSSTSNSAIPMTTSPSPYNEDQATYYREADTKRPQSQTFSPSELDRSATIKPAQRSIPPPPPRHPSLARGVTQTPVSAVARGLTAPPASSQTTPRHQSSTDSNMTMSDPAIAAAVASAAMDIPSLAKKRAEFKVRLERAKEGMPPDVPFVIFVHPQECMDIANRILSQISNGGR